MCMSACARARVCNLLSAPLRFNHFDFLQCSNYGFFHFNSELHMCSISFWVCECSNLCIEKFCACVCACVSRSGVHSETLRRVRG